MEIKSQTNFCNGGLKTLIKIPHGLKHFCRNVFVRYRFAQTLSYFGYIQVGKCPVGKSWVRNTRGGNLLGRKISVKNFCVRIVGSEIAEWEK